MLWRAVDHEGEVLEVFATRKPSPVGTSVKGGQT
jgi:hypothetical protein